MSGADQIPFEMQAIDAEGAGLLLGLAPRVIKVATHVLQPLRLEAGQRQDVAINERH